MNKDGVIAEIKTAFSGVELGDGIGLWQAQAIDDYETEAVEQQNREKDEKNDWTALNPEVLQRCHSSLSFFDADGMRFHLPAFMIASINDDVDDPVFHLTHLDDYAKSKFTSLTPEQRKAVVTYLEWCLEQNMYEFEHPLIKRTLIEYWEK